MFRFENQAITRNRVLRVSRVIAGMTGALVMLAACSDSKPLEDIPTPPANRPQITGDALTDRGMLLVKRAVDAACEKSEQELTKPTTDLHVSHGAVFVFTNTSDTTSLATTFDIRNDAPRTLDKRNPTAFIDVDSCDRSSVTFSKYNTAAEKHRYEKDGTEPKTRSEVDIFLPVQYSVSFVKGDNKLLQDASAISSPLDHNNLPTRHFTAADYDSAKAAFLFADSVIRA